MNTTWSDKALDVLLDFADRMWATRARSTATEDVSSVAPGSGSTRSTRKTV